MKPSSGKKSILFVDDELMLTKWFERTFGAEFPIVCANSVDDALLVLQSNSYDIAVVITDFRMPGRDGLELLRTLATSHPAIVKILASAYADKDLVIQAVNQQLVFRVLEKPWDNTLVRRTLTDALEHHQDYVREREQLTSGMKGIQESLGFLAHELSSPLSTISSYLEMLQDAHITLADTKATMAGAQQRILFCLNLVSSFTDSSRQAFGHSKPEAQSAVRLVNLMLDKLPISPEQRGMITVQSGYDFAISGKHNLVYLCLCSVVNNALRELPNLQKQPSPRIHIDLGFNQKHWIRITDNAAGIAPEVFPNLLKQPHTTYAERGGNGMGLIFCQKVMHSLAGDITLETRHASSGFAPDQTGTSVYLHFPSMHPPLTSAALESLPL